ncbi:MAG: hypothetical protein OK457_01935 [Thaumarchaeota archaeon]|nr:hypothetical protein [Nitrososphaerota archaeon]
MTLFGSKKRKPEAAKQLVQEQLPTNPNSHLKDFVPNDEKMFTALQNFLLADPERQLPMLGGTDALQARGDAAKAKGDKLVARMSYETAAKIEIYKQNKENAEKYIRLAQEVSENTDSHQAAYATMLGNMDEVLQVSKSYSSSVSHRKP